MNLFYFIELNLVNLLYIIKEKRKIIIIVYIIFFRNLLSYINNENNIAISREKKLLLRVYKDIKKIYANY